MIYLVVDVVNNAELLETTNCHEAIETAILKKAELFVSINSVWYGWTDELGFIGPRPKHPPTR
jgi:hypothetical protein